MTRCRVSCGLLACRRYGCWRDHSKVKERQQELLGPFTPLGLAADAGPDYGDDRDPEDRVIEIVDRIKAIGK